MGFERVFAGSKVDPGFYDVYEVEDVLDPVVLPDTQEGIEALKGTVSTARKMQSEDTKLYVVKSIFKANMVRERVKRECDINFQIRHRNITHVHEVFETDTEVILIMDYMEGGDLFDRVAKAANFALPECEVHEYMVQLVDVVVYLHDMGIAHRDLKPENVMFENKQVDARLCVLDFGFAKHTDETLETPIGTLQYLAPEVLETGTYDKSVDIWSVGCILYFMLFGKTPFLAPSDEATVARAAEVEFQFPENVTVSDNAKDLISSLLRKDPSERLTARQIKNHPWFVNGPAHSPLASSNELQSNSQSEIHELRASINLAIDHARQAADVLVAAASQKSPRAAGASIPPTSPESGNKSTATNVVRQSRLTPLHDSPAYRKRIAQKQQTPTSEAVGPNPSNLNLSPSSTSST